MVHSLNIGVWLSSLYLATMVRIVRGVDIEDMASAGQCIISFIPIVVSQPLLCLYFKFRTQ